MVSLLPPDGATRRLRIRKWLRLSQSFVCVLIDADAEPAVCRQFGVTGYPDDSVSFAARRAVGAGGGQEAGPSVDHGDAGGAAKRGPSRRRRGGRRALGRTHSRSKRRCVILWIARMRNKRVMSMPKSTGSVAEGAVA